MKASISKKHLLDGIRTAAHAIRGRTALPILSHVLIASEGNSLRFSATDHQIGISTTVPAQVLEEGELALPASFAAEVISSLPEADVILESTEGNQVRVSCPPSEFQIVSLSPSEFPGLPEVPDTTWFEIEAKQLRTGLRRTEFACSVDELRAILLGVLFVYSGDTLKCVATDTHRLAVDTRMVKAGEGEARAVVPSRAINELSRLLTDEGDVRVHISERQVMFTLGTLTLTATLIEGQYPNYERVIPTESDKRIVVPTALFLPAVRRAEIVARADLSRAVLKTSGEKVSIRARSGTVGQAYEEVEAVREGDDIEIAFNAGFLLDVLNVIDSEGVQMDMDGPLSPTVVRPADADDGYLCVVMPMQLQEGLDQV
ncbi:MAG: DNA polymerase III subunit beta [Armatimonadetes bacterium]|nr:DNA polymerase III subunit beta [Armatimonadota bacterium]